MSPVSYLITVLAAASFVVGIGIPSCKPSQTLLKQIIPASQQVLTASADPTSFVLLGIGYQNYTCNDAGKFAAVGATADLFDVSCAAKTPAASAAIAEGSFKLWTKCKKTDDAIAPGFGANKVLSGKHFFSTSPSGTGISPVWDMRSIGPASVKGKADAFVLAAKTGNIPAPTGAKDVDWLQLSNVQGKLGTAIYRVDTRGGPAPASCTAGESTRVKYTSIYIISGCAI